MEKESKVIEKEEKKPKISTKKDRKTGETTKDTPVCIKRRRCIIEIRETIEDLGPWSVNKSELARKYYVNWHTVDGWMKGVLKSLNRESLENISSMGEKLITKSLKELESLILRGKSRDRISAIATMNKTLDSLRSWLESFGRKNKVAEKIDINQDNKLEVEVVVINKKEDEDSDDNSVP